MPGKNLPLLAVASHQTRERNYHIRKPLSFCLQNCVRWWENVLWLVFGRRLFGFLALELPVCQAKTGFDGTCGYSQRYSSTSAQSNLVENFTMVRGTARISSALFPDNYFAVKNSRITMESGYNGTCIKRWYHLKLFCASRWDAGFHWLNPIYIYIYIYQQG